MRLLFSDTTRLLILIVFIAWVAVYFFITLLIFGCAYGTSIEEAMGVNFQRLTYDAENSEIRTEDACIDLAQPIHFRLARAAPQLELAIPLNGCLSSCVQIGLTAPTRMESKIPTYQHDAKMTEDQTRSSAAEQAATNSADNFRDEWRYVLRRREVAFSRTEHGLTTGNSTIPSSELLEKVTPLPEQAPKDLVGLALSGGGLRSALFNDGFLQALSHKGVLRFVDYLCSVSGGGYIAGHLMTHTRPAPKKSGSDDTHIKDPARQTDLPENFHELKEHWELGRDARSGKEDPQRLVGIGGYLNRRVEFFFGFVMRQLPVMLLYLSFVAMITTIVAIYFRSFDAPLFRMVFISGLGVNFGNELFIAFLPTFMVGIVWTFIAVSNWLLDLLAPSMNRSEQGPKLLLRIALGANRLNELLGIVFLFCILTSIAVFLGNDVTKISGSSKVENTDALNHYALMIGVLAALLQILVFFGRDRLFKSEQSESSRAKKVIQSLVSYGVVLLAVFAMLHAMARENISEYVNWRDPYLVRGEILDWNLIVDTMEDYKQQKGSQDVANDRPNLDYGLWARSNHLGFSKAGQLWHFDSRLDQSDPPFPKPPISQSRAWEKPNLTPARRNLYLGQLCLLPENWIVGDGVVANLFGVSEFSREAHKYQKDQTKYLEKNNPLLNEAGFTEFLLGRLKPDQSEEQLSNSATKRASVVDLLGLEHIKVRLQSWSPARVRLLEKLLNQHNLKILSEADDQLKPSNIIDRVRLNRDLLELMGRSENVLARLDAASTPVIQPHDQKVRWQMLYLWMSLFAVSLVFTNRLNRNSFLFRFYHQSINRSFLRRESGFVNGDTPVSRLQPWEHGLPFPIYLCAWQKPPSVQGQGQVSCGLAISPQNITLYDVPQATCSQTSEAEAVYRLNDHSVRLSTAVSVSGSAVEPGMTNNPALSLLMDFFGARLGMWFSNPALGNAPSENLKRGWRTSTIIMVLGVFVIATWAFLGVARDYFPHAMSMFLIILLLICLLIRQGQGYPFKVWAQFRASRMQRSSHETDGVVNNRVDPITRCFPEIFVSDGGFYDYLGISELLRRQCDLIIVSDAGINKGSTALENLAQMCERSSAEYGVKFVDLDHDSPIEFGRLKRNTLDNVAQPYLVVRIKYPKTECATAKDGLLVYAQMAITDNDPIEIQQIRRRFPSFPDEPTSNQFYTADQVAAYRELGYHIGNRLSSQMQRWSAAELRSRDHSPSGQPLFEELEQRLKRSYIQTCFEEVYFKEDEVYGESIWSTKTLLNSLHESQVECLDTTNFPSFLSAVNALRKRFVGSDELVQASHFWLDQFHENADVRQLYMLAVSNDVNSMSSIDLRTVPSTTLKILYKMFESAHQHDNSDSIDKHRVLSDGDFLAFYKDKLDSREELPCLAAHYCVMAVAAQQLHRGTPHAIFQVGGREKLCEVVAHLVRDLTKRMSDRKAPARFAHDLTSRIIHEVFELTQCVFQSADTLAVITLSQCLCKELAPIVAAGSNSNDSTAKVVSQSDSVNQFQLSLDYRRLMQHRLNLGYRSKVAELMSAYLTHLAVGSPESDLFYDDTIRARAEVVA